MHERDIKVCKMISDIKKPKSFGDIESLNIIT